MISPVHTFVCLSLSITHSQWFCHNITMRFQGIITFGKSDVQANGQGQRRKVKVTHRGPNKMLIQIWLPIDAQSFKWDRWGARPIVFQDHLSNFKVTWTENSAILPWCRYFWMIIPVSITSTQVTADRGALRIWRWVSLPGRGQKFWLQWQLADTAWLASARVVGTRSARSGLATHQHNPTLWTAKLPASKLDCRE